jgi:hypothetical protein
MILALAKLANVAKAIACPCYHKRPARQIPILKKQTFRYICLNNMESDSFYVQAFYKGGMNSFEVIPIENYFVIAFGGEFIAKIQHNEDWEQTSGEPLDEDVFITIKQAIEDHN